MSCNKQFVLFEFIPDTLRYLSGTSMLHYHGVQERTAKAEEEEDIFLNFLSKSLSMKMGY